MIMIYRTLRSRPARLAAGLLLAAGVAAAADPPPKDQPPPAPQKTTAELLVGTWQLLKSGDETFDPKGYHLRFEFTAKGELTIRRHNSPRPKPRVDRGAYVVIGKTIKITLPTQGPEDQERVWVIDRLDGDTLHVTATAVSKGTSSKGEFRRFNENESDPKK
jgi:hypothetical protein